MESSHVKKNVQWLLVDMVRQGARKLDDFKTMFNPSAEHPTFWIILNKSVFALIA